jgi:hypothetical protein
MPRLEGLLDGVDYHHFYLQAGDPTEAPSYPETGWLPNRMLATTDTGDAVCVITGIAMGVIQLTIDVLDTPPSGTDESQKWEAVAEVSFEATETTAAVVMLMTGTNAPFGSFELPRGLGWYRIRGHAVGRSLDNDLVVTENPREHHLLQLWPADRWEEPLALREDDPWASQGVAT